MLYINLQIDNTFFISKRILFFLIFSHFCIQIKAQVTWSNTGCSSTHPTIDKVFIDACATPEGSNEFAYMTTGSNPFDWSNLEITGSGTGFTSGVNTGASTNPSLNNRPISSAFTSNPTVVAALNAGVGATCNPAVFYVAPNPIPPGSAVIIRMSSDPVTLPNGTNALSTLCGKGPVYVLTGTYIGTPGFFRNAYAGCNTSPVMPNTDPCTRIATFDMGNGCVQTVSYNIQTFPSPNSSTIGAFLTSSGTTGITNDCYESPPCSTAAPSLSHSQIDFCLNSSQPFTKIDCSNCGPLNYYYVYDAMTGGNLIYSGLSGTFPPNNFTLPSTNVTYFFEQKFGFCTSNRTPVQFNLKTTPTINSIPNQIFCDNTSCITLSASGTTGATYSWSPTNGIANPNSATTQFCNVGNSIYTLTSNLNGCSKSIDVNFSTNSSLQNIEITQGNIISCKIPSTLLSANPKGSNFSYLWSQGSTTSSINVLSSDFYSVTVTDNNNGCTKSTTIKALEDKTTVPVVINGNTTLTCSQAITTLSVGGNNSFQWSGSGILTSTTGASVNVNAAGNYSVTMTNLSNGCTSTSNTTVSTNFIAPTTPDINPSNPSLSCSNTFATLSSSASNTFSHQWKLNGSLVGSGTQYNATQAGTYNLVITDTSNGCTASTSTNVTSTNVVLSVTANGGKITCTNPSVILNVNAATAVSYKWTASNFNSTQQNPIATSAGTYTVIATDANGCTGSAQATVLSDTQKPNVTASTNGTLSCANPNVTLNASSGTAGLTYVWASNSGFNASGNPVTTQQAGIITVTATNSTNGCTNTANVTVTASNDKPILATTGGTITCKDSIININVVVTGNTIGLNYKWSGPSSFTNTTASANVKKSGDYIVTVTASNGCSSIATAKVTADNQVITAQIETSKAFICSTDSISLTAKSASTIQSYLWSNSTIKNNTTITKSGTYQVTVTGDNGCKGSASVTVTDGAIPIIALNADSLTCSISKLIIGAKITWGTPIAPSWTGVNNFTSSVLQPEVNAAGTYKLSVNPADGCPASAEITIKENKTPPVVKISGEFINCEESPVTLIAASTAANFLWSGFGVDANTSATVTATKSGKYSVTSTSSNGCISQDSVEVKIFPAITSSADMTICSSGNSSLINLTVGGGKSPFVLTDSSGVLITSNMVKPKTGLLPITIVDANGCKSQISTIKATLGLLAIDKTTTIVKDATGTQFNGSITLTTTGITGTAKYAWSNGVLTKDLLGLNAATYCVTVTDDLGCSVTECFTVKSVISTEDNILAQAIRVFPNPTNEMLYLETTESIDIQGITLLNDKGQTLSRFDSFVSQINLSLLPQGIYFLKIESQNGDWAMKRIVKL